MQADMPAQMSPERVQPLCPVFGKCGGCQYQDLPYPQELAVKQRWITELLSRQLPAGSLPGDCIAPIVPSGRDYFYRSRLDISILKTRDQTVMGFSTAGRYSVIPVENCPIAVEPIGRFLPELKRQAMEKLLPRYRIASLVVKTGDDGRVVWGGIGRRSLRMKEEDFLWTEIRGKRIFYSLETFFQPNFSILPKVIERIESLGILDQQTVFWDLYGGVGLFGILLSALVKQVILIEENKHSILCARHNSRYHGLDQRLAIYHGKIEAHLPLLLPSLRAGGALRHVAMIDPPRLGLSPRALELLTGSREFSHQLYLSCQPESLARDLAAYISAGWQIAKIMPFDFFPKTKHVEMLVLLKRKVGTAPTFPNEAAPKK